MHLGRPRSHKKRISHTWLDVFNTRRIPLGFVVLGDSQSAYAFNGFTLRTGPQVKSVMHDIALHTQIVCQAHAASAADLLQRHMQHQG